MFLNAGIMTFYQNNVPIHVMGRVTSIYQFIQSVAQVIFLLFIGFIADLINLRLTIVALALVMLLSSFIFSVSILKPSKKGFYQEDDIEKRN